jgi:hypothetical protein
VLDGAQAMSDDQGGAALEQAVESLADQHFGGGIDAGGGFVENQESGIVGEGAREADQLALADGESGTALGDFLRYALGQPAM